jgi:DNA-binding ferritin-like protein
MADKRLPSSSRAPWWSERGRTSKPADEPAQDAPASSSRPPNLDWFDRREPFLNALAARLEPLEERARALDSDLSAFREEVRTFAEETVRTLGEIEKELIGLRDRSDEHAGRLDERFTSRLGELAGTVREQARARADDVALAAREAATETEESVKARIAQGEASLEARIAALEWAVLARVAEAAEESGSRLDRADRALRGRLEEIASALGARVDEVATALGTALASIQARVDQSPARTDVEALGNTLEVSADALRRAVAESRQSLESSLSRTADRMRADQAKGAQRMQADQAKAGERLAERLSKSIGELEAGFARVSRLAEVIETLGRRRAFQELIESERALRDEQSSMVGRLREAGDAVAEHATTLGQRIDRLEARLSGAADELGSLEQVPAAAAEGVAEAIERLRGTLQETLGERFAGEVDRSVERLRAELEAGVPVKETLTRLQELAATQGEVWRAQRQVEELSTSLRSDVTQLRKTIEGWGKPRTAPQLSEELRAVEGRVSALETEVGGLVEAVSTRVTDRVLEALENRKRRGLLRR